MDLAANLVAAPKGNGRLLKEVEAERKVELDVKEPGEDCTTLEPLLQAADALFALRLGECLVHRALI
jgi:hypothetical protein